MHGYKSQGPHRDADLTIMVTAEVREFDLQGALTFSEHIVARVHYYVKLFSYNVLKCVKQ